MDLWGRISGKRYPSIRGNHRRGAVVTFRCMRGRLGGRPGGHKLECGRGLRLLWADMDALLSAYVIDIVNVEGRDAAHQQSSALPQEMLDALGVASRSQSLPMSVLLVAWGTSIGTGGTSRIFRIALIIIRISELEIAVGVARDSALALIFLLLHRAQAS